MTGRLMLKNCVQPFYTWTLDFSAQFWALESTLLKQLCAVLGVGKYI
jgi:hypothetical protein